MKIGVNFLLLLFLVLALAARIHYFDQKSVHAVHTHENHESIDDNDNVHEHTHRHSPNEPEHTHNHSHQAPTSITGLDFQSIFCTYDVTIPPSPASIANYFSDEFDVFQSVSSAIFRPPIV